MYRPNFCAECGAKIVRLKWRFWTSRSFCDSCAKLFRTERLKKRLIFPTLLLCLGFISGRAGRPPSPPLTIERPAGSPLSHPQGDEPKTTKPSGPDHKKTNSESSIVEQEVYICGARTKKGKACSRRVHGPVRCWQHRGLPAMLLQEELVVKD